MSCEPSCCVVIAGLIVLLLIVCCYNTELFTVNQSDWTNMSRGMNTPNTFGYEPTVELLRHMEIAKAGNINVDLSERIPFEIKAAEQGMYQ